MKGYIPSRQVLKTRFIINKLPNRLEKKFLEIKKTLFNLPKALLGFLDEGNFIEISCPEN